MNTFRPVRIGVFLVVLFVYVVTPAIAQDGSDPYAFVIYAEGYNLSVFRNDEMTTYDVLVDDVIGMPLLPGDLVQTDDDTFVEMQVMPSRTIVKIAENTTFEIERIGGAGGGTFDMSYGRMRARVERLTQDDRFEIRGFSAVAGVRGTDFGYDMVVEREAAGELQTKVYVFDGEVDVSENTGQEAVSGPSTEGRAETVRLEANEMVSVVSAVPEEVARRADEIAGTAPGEEGVSPAVEAAPRKVVFRQEQIETEIQDFWQRKDFAEDAIDPDTVEEKFPGINARVRRLSEERRQYDELQRMRREGLLMTTEELLAESEESFEEEPEREPREVALGAAAEGDRIERLLLPDQSAPQAVQLRQAGHWLLGAGVVMELAGLAGAWYIDDARSFDELRTGAAGNGAIIGGGVFFGSGLLSYLLSLVVD